MEICKTVGVSKSYCYQEQEINAIYDCNLVLKSGECIAIRGEKSSGKSTLLRILCGLERPTTGEVYIGNQDISGFSDDELAVMRRSMIGYLFQGDRLIPELNVYENIMMPAIFDHNKRDAEYQKDLIRQLHLKELLYCKPKQLTDRQLQTVLYARAMINNPSLILIDETGKENEWVLDRSIFDHLLYQIYKSDKTLIMATDSDDFNIYMDRVIRLENGLIVENRRVS